MKKTWNIYIALLCSLFSFYACSEKESVILGLTLDKEELTLGEHGGTENLKVSSDLEWKASASQPWLRLSPANGIGSTECTVVVDSSLVSGIRQGNIVIRTENGAAKTIVVKQTGYDKVISINTDEVNLESTGQFGSRFFEVSITTNALLDLEIEEDDQWISFDENQLDIDLDRGERPRTVKFRFDWAMNTREEMRTAELVFKAKGVETPIESTLKVVQQPAPTITDSRAGDSLAIVLIHNRIAAYAIIDPTEPMTNWDAVTLWERGDKKANGEEIGEEWIGRVRYVQFYMNRTEEEIPFETSKLKYAETISYYSNSNSHLLSLDLGDAFNGLTNLRNLEIISFGLVSIPEGFGNLTGLEVLNLRGNNFTKIPDVLTPANFPNLKYLGLTYNRRGDVRDLSTTEMTNQGLHLNISNSDGGQDLEQFKRLLSWDSLESLLLGLNFIEGNLPTDQDLINSGFPVYTSADIAGNDTLAVAGEKGLIGMPKVLPNAREFRLNLNMLTGSLPNWVLYHPNLIFMDPFTLIFNQENGGFNSEGKPVGFTNTPANWDYYYQWYPLRDPNYKEQ